MEVKLNKSDPNINMQFDQDQLMQITQLINNLNSQQNGQQQQQQQMTHDHANPGSDFQFQFHNLIDNETTLFSNQSNQGTRYMSLFQPKFRQPIFNSFNFILSRDKSYKI